MNTIQRITKNVSLLFISQMLCYVLGFFTLLKSARYLGVEGFGTLSLALAFTGIFSVCMDLGLTTLTIREVARDKSLAKDYISHITLIKIVLSIITLILIVLILHIIGYDKTTMNVIYLIAVYTIFNTFSQLFLAVFQANEKMEYQSLGSILSSSLLLVGIILAIYNNFDIIHFSSIYLIVGVIYFIYIILIFSWKFSFPTIKFNTNKIIAILRESWPFAITGISINLYLWIDTIILSILQGQEAVGLYNASYKLIMILLVIPVIFNNAIFPLMSQYFISSKESLMLLFEKLLKIMIVVGLPLGVGTVIIANQIISLIYGEQFNGAVIALQILIWSTVLIFIRSPFERLLESSNRQIVVTKVFIIGVIFNVILNVIIIPKYSYIGAGLITVITDALVLGLFIFSIRNMEIYISKKTLLSSIKICVASIIMGLTLIHLVNLNIILYIIIGTVIYILVLLLLKTFDDDEIRMIKSIFKRGN